jgi:hypothetical protein
VGAGAHPRQRATCLSLPVRILGLIAASLFVATALQIFAGIPLSPISSPLPFFVYPFFVATFFGWIWTLLKAGGLPNLGIEIVAEGEGS